MYIIKYLKQRQFKNAFLYTTTLIASALSGIIIFPYSINHIFFSYRGEGIKTSLLDFENLVSKVIENIRIINTEIFNNGGTILIIIAFVFCIWCFFVSIKKERKQKRKNTSIKYVAIPMVAYLAFSVVCSPYIDLRYLMPVIPLIFCSIIYMFYNLLKDIMNSKNAFCIILVISICFAISVIPKLSNNSYTYKGHKETLECLENKLSMTPMVYIYDDYSAQYNKTMECYEALTKIDKTYIMSKDKFSIDNIKQVLKDVDTNEGVLIMMHYLYKNNVLDELLYNNIFTTSKYTGRLGRFVIYELK